MGKLDESEELVTRCVSLIEKQSERITELEDDKEKQSQRITELEDLLRKALSNVYQTPPKTIKGPPGAPVKSKLVPLISPGIETDKKDSKSEDTVPKKTSHVRSVYVEGPTPVVEE